MCVKLTEDWPGCYWQPILTHQGATGMGARSQRLVGWYSILMLYTSCIHIVIHMYIFIMNQLLLSYNNIIFILHCRKCNANQQHSVEMRITKYCFNNCNNQYNCPVFDILLHEIMNAKHAKNTKLLAQSTRSLFHLMWYTWTKIETYIWIVFITKLQCISIIFESFWDQLQIQLSQIKYVAFADFS